MTIKLTITNRDNNKKRSWWSLSYEEISTTYTYQMRSGS